MGRNGFFAAGLSFSDSLRNRYVSTQFSGCVFKKTEKIMELIILLLVIPVAMFIGALVTIYYYGLIAVVLFSVVGAMYSGGVLQALRDFGKPNGGGSSFDGLQMLKDSLFALVLIALTLMFYYGAVRFFKDGRYLYASFFLALLLTPPLFFVATEIFDYHDVSLKKITGFLDKKNPFRQTYEKNDKALKAAFDNAMNEKKSIRSFIKMSSKIARNSPYVKKLDFQFANYSTKLLLSRLVKKDYESAEKIVDNYIDNIFPFSGYHKKSDDVASNALALSILNNDEKMGQKVIDELLGPDFEISTENNEMLLFNLACYYATRRQKDMMLQAIERALDQGKKSGQFFSDADFTYYLEDEDFIALLQRGKEDDHSRQKPGGMVVK